MEKLYEKMGNLECGLYNYIKKCDDYWCDIGKWQPKENDIFKFANAFTRLASYKPQRPISLEERVELARIQAMMAVMAALIETCALNFPACNIEDDFMDARDALNFWLEGHEDNGDCLWCKRYEENIFQKHWEALKRARGETEQVGD